MKLLGIIVKLYSLIFVKVISLKLLYQTFTIVLCLSLTVVETMNTFFLMSSSFSPLFMANFICFLISFVIKMLSTFFPSTISSRSSSVSYRTIYSYPSTWLTFESPKNSPSSYFYISIYFFFILISSKCYYFSTFCSTTSIYKAC